MEKIDYPERRQHFLEMHLKSTDNSKEDSSIDYDLLTNQIPDIVSEIMKAEFGIKFAIPNATFPITFIVGWTKVLEYLRSQPEKEYAVDICGLRIGYYTDYHDGDKANNITPILQHVRQPVFMKDQPSPISGVDFTQDLLQKYNTWRSVNLNEIITKIENETFDVLLNEYGIDILLPEAVFPIMAAIYSTAIEFAKKREDEYINLYKIFLIKYKQGHILPKELGFIKQTLKGDEKNTYMNS